MKSVPAKDAKTNLSELLDRAEKGESFEITKEGRPVARLVPVEEPDRAEARAAADQFRRWLSEGTPVSEQEAQQNWEQLKAELEAEDEKEMDPWPSSSTPR